MINEQKVQKHHLYKNAVSCFNHGLITESQFNLLTRAMHEEIIADDDGRHISKLKYKGVPYGNSFTAHWTFELEASV